MTTGKLIKTEGDGEQLLQVRVFERESSLQVIRVIAKEMGINLYDEKEEHGLKKYYEYVKDCIKNNKEISEYGTVWIENDIIHFEW